MNPTELVKYSMESSRYGKLIELVQNLPETDRFVVLVWRESYAQHVRDYIFKYRGETVLANAEVMGLDHLRQTEQGLPVYVDHSVFEAIAISFVAEFNNDQNSN